MSDEEIENPRNPYKIPVPFYVSFSGGRTSGMMLAKIIEAYGGKLPDGGFALFANTGRENEATYKFIEQFAQHFNIDIKWLEYSPDEKYRVVDFKTASRFGEPFKHLIDKKKYLPNPITRFCTSYLKVRPMNLWMKDRVAENFATVIGLRHDEPRRVSRLRSDTSRDIFLPLDEDKVTKADVLSYWSKMPFDLNLPNGDEAFSNCDLCFLKNMAAIHRVVATDPSTASWWIDAENAMSAQFRKDRPKYSQILRYVTIHGMAYQGDNNEPTLPCDCTE